MNEYQDNLQEENLYLEETLALIHREIESQTKKFNNKKNELLALKREMMQDTGGTGVYQGVAENSQYLTEVNSSTAIYNHINMQIRKHKSLINSPYFGRIDFLEEGEDKAEKLYIGLATLIDSESNDIYIYDWRAPISSIYYQYGRGEAEYLSPMGKIKGLVSLKRQYKIKDSKLLYFFDCNIAIK
ncbi:MAG: ATP-dependent DNA helicase, partial [Peptococcaceae bacterium]|nr:ATP-dependent DNA helicase [Peptococcaceae bacterium]